MIDDVTGLVKVKCGLSGCTRANISISREVATSMASTSERSVFDNDWFFLSKNA